MIQDVNIRFNLNVCYMGTDKSIFRIKENMNDRLKMLPMKFKNSYYGFNDTLRSISESINISVKGKYKI